MTKYKAILSGKRNIDESNLRRGRAFRWLGVSLFSPQVLHESAFLELTDKAHMRILSIDLWPVLTAKRHSKPFCCHCVQTARRGR